MAKNTTHWKQIFWFFVLAPILLLVLVVTALLYPLLKIYEQWIKYRFWRRHGRFGRCILFVYSDSPNWKTYIEQTILPDIQPYVVILNWSNRKEWPKTNPFEAQVFHRWAGEKEFNPIAIIPDGTVKVVRFWRAFREFKHGKDTLLKEAERMLLDEVMSCSAKSGD